MGGMDTSSVEMMPMSEYASAQNGSASGSLQAQHEARQQILNIRRIHTCGALALHDASATQENTLHDQQDDSIHYQAFTHSLTHYTPSNPQIRCVGAADIPSGCGMGRLRTCERGLQCRAHARSLRWRGPAR